MKVIIAGYLESSSPVKPGKSGFTQSCIIYQPEIKDPATERVTARANWFTVHIYSTKQTDSRFKANEQAGQQVKAELYLSGERWAGHTGLCYNNKLNLSKWL